MPDINDLRRDRTSAAQAMEDCANAIAALEDSDTAEDAEEMVAAVQKFADAEAAFKAADTKVKRAETVENAKAQAAVGDDAQNGTGASMAPAAPKNPAEKGIEAGLMFQALAACRGDKDKAISFLEDGGHSGVSAALSGASESAGGVTIPRPQAQEIIELLRPMVAVRNSGARRVEMPAGEIRNARQSGSATASYDGENLPIQTSEPTFDKVEQTFKKLGSLVPVGNSLLRHATPTLAALVRDDMLEVMAAREDLAFIRGDGASNTPVGLRNWVLAPSWAAAVTNTPAVVDAAVRGCVSRVEDTNVKMVNCGWIMRGATKNFLASLREAAGGNKLFPSIEANGTLMGYPIKTTSQIPINLGVGGNETEVYFADFNEVFIGDAMDVQFATSTEATYIDGGGVVHSAFQEDKTLFRAISEHDLAPRHDVALSGLNGVDWTL